MACILDVASNSHCFTIVTSPASVHDLLVELVLDRLLIEAPIPREHFQGLRPRTPAS